MTPLLGTKTSSTPVGDVPTEDNKTAQSKAFQVFTRPESRDTALAWRDAQASANSEVFTNHETRITAFMLFTWLEWCAGVLKPFSLFFLPPGVLSMKIMTRDQGLDSFPASACEVKSLPLQIVLFGCVPCEDFPLFPGISHDFPAFPSPPPPALQAPRMRNKVPGAPRVWPSRSLTNLVQPPPLPLGEGRGEGAEHGSNGAQGY